MSDDKVISMTPDQPDGDAVLRSACSESLISFAMAMNVGYQPSRVHELIASKLEDCRTRKIRRLCISQPPRTGKSALASVLFPAWAMTLDPTLEIVGASYSAELSGDFSTSSKGVLLSPAYLQLFPPIVHPEGNRQNDWKTLSGGRYLATSPAGGLTGKGSSITILDDITKNREEAESELVRETIWRW